MPAGDDNTLLPLALPSICKKKVTAAFDGGRISSDGGVLLLAGADRRLGLIDTLAAIIPDHRDPAHITHTLSDILRARVFAILRLPRRRRSGRSAHGAGVQVGRRTPAGERR